MPTPAKKPRVKRETTIVSFRFDTAAKAALEKQATAARMSTRAWLEQAVLTNKTKVVVPPDEHLLRGLHFQISRAGNNLNQIAHKLNSLDLAGRLTPEGLSNGISQLADIRQLLDKALARAR